MDIDRLKLSDFAAKKVAGGTIYQANDCPAACLIYDALPDKEDPEKLLAEIKASIKRSMASAKNNG